MKTPTIPPSLLLMKARIWTSNGINLLIAGAAVWFGVLMGIPMDYLTGLIALAGLGNIAAACLCRSEANRILRIERVEREAGIKGVGP